jgi:hypothetical protein
MAMAQPAKPPPSPYHLQQRFACESLPMLADAFTLPLHRLILVLGAYRTSLTPQIALRRLSCRLCFGCFCRQADVIQNPSDFTGLHHKRDELHLLQRKHFLDQVRSDFVHASGAA